MTRNNTIFACVHPIQAHWQLGPLHPAKGQIILVGWRLAIIPVDEGVPSLVGLTIASALTSVARVSFPISEAKNGKDHVQTLASGSLLERAEAVIRHAPLNVSLLSTHDPKKAIRLFQDLGYPWHLQGQVALLSPLHSDPPAIDRKDLLSLMADDWVERSMQLASRGIVGVLRPGVDGDIAAILSLDDAFTKSLLEALESAARDAAFDWSLLTEHKFIEALS
jgi:hypothetical protein